MKYYMCDESEYVFTLADFKIMLTEEEEERMELFEVKREYGGEMWCKRGERFIKKWDCGRTCEDYQPCNGKSGRCRNLENGFIKTGKKFILTKFGLEEIK